MTDADKKIRAFKNKLKKLYAEIPENRYDIAVSLIDNIAFMQCQLEILRGQILEHGMVSIYDNGKIQQDVVSPYAKAYNQIAPKYLQAIQQLNKLLPVGAAPPTKDELSEYTPTGI